MEELFENSSFLEKCRKHYLTSRFEAEGLTYLEGIVLLAVNKNQLSNQDSISRIAGSDKFRTARVLTALEKKGLIVREINEDNKRENLVRTAPGSGPLVERLRQVQKEWNDMCCRGFTGEERMRLKQMVERITYNILTAGRERQRKEQQKATAEKLT